MTFEEILRKVRAACGDFLVTAVNYEQIALEVRPKCERLHPIDPVPEAILLEIIDLPESRVKAIADRYSTGQSWEDMAVTCVAIWQANEATNAVIRKHKLFCREDAR